MTTLTRFAVLFVPALVLLPACAEGVDGEGGASTSASQDGGATSPFGEGEGEGEGNGQPRAGQDGGAPVDPGAEAKCEIATKSYGTMKMWECAPAGMEGKTGKPAGLVVALHGYTQGVDQKGSPGNAWGFRSTSQWAKLAAKNGFYVIFPDKGTQAFQWYSFFGTSGIARTDLEPTGIANMVKDMQAKHDIDPEKIFVNGLSAGAYMSVVMLATYPDLFSAGATFAGGAYGCNTQCAALGKKGQGWTFPGNHAASLVKNAHAAVWNAPAARKPRLMIFQGDADGAVTMENLADLSQQWAGAVGAGAGAKSQVKGHELVEYSAGGKVMVAAVTMKGIGHGTPVDPGAGPDQGGWDPEPSQTMKSDTQAAQDWTNSAGIYGPYYAAKFFGLVK